MSDFKVGDVVTCDEESHGEHVVERVEARKVWLDDGTFARPEELQHVKAAVGQLARWDGQSWRPIEEQTLEVADPDWWDVDFERVVVKGGGVDNTIWDALGLQVRVQARRAVAS